MATAGRAASRGAVGYGEGWPVQPEDVGLCWGTCLWRMALAHHGHMKEADLQESTPDKAQPGWEPTSTLLWIFSLSGHLVLSQDSSF